MKKRFVIIVDENNDDGLVTLDDFKKGINFWLSNMNSGFSPNPDLKVVSVNEVKTDWSLSPKDAIADPK